MSARPNLRALIQEAGVRPVSDRQPSLPAPTQPLIIASEEDHTLARSLLVEQRVNGPDYQDPGKQLKRIFRSSKEKDKLQDTSQWEFTQDELDRALLAVIDKPGTSSALVQAFLDLGAKVNFVDVPNKKSKGGKRPGFAEKRRSTVLQRAATVRRADSLSLLASSGADQVTLNEGLKAAVAANNHPCVQELLRHGADPNECPNALADAVRSNDHNFVRLLLRAPKSLRPEIVSSCLPAATHQTSGSMISLLIGHGADPNYSDASSLVAAVSQRQYHLAVALVAGPIPLTAKSLQAVFGIVIEISDAQDLYKFLRLMLCCGLSPSNSTLGGLLIAACHRNDSRMAEMLISYDVPTSLEESKCLKEALANANLRLVDVILETPIPPAHASMALDVVPSDLAKADRLRIIGGLLTKGASGRSLEQWLVRAVEDGDADLMDLLLNAGTPISDGGNRAIQAAVVRKDNRSLHTLLASRPSPRSLAQVFPLIRSGYTAPERFATVRVLLEHGARGPEVDQALIDAVADTSSSRNIALIAELVRHGATVDYDNGRVIKLAVSQADVATLRLLCGANPSLRMRSAAIPLIFDVNGDRRFSAASMLELLLLGGVEEEAAMTALQIAIKGGSHNIDIVERLVAADGRLVGHAFNHVMELSNMRYKEGFLRHLLNKGISQETLDQALVAESRRVVETDDVASIRLLLAHGASVNVDSGEALVRVATAGHISLVKLLLSGKDAPSQATATNAFRSLFDVANLRRLSSSIATSKDTDRTVDGQVCGQLLVIAKALLAIGVDQTAIDVALQCVLDLESGLIEIDALVEYLLSHHADINAANGRSFVLAARRNSMLFAKLLVHRPNFSTLVPSLIDSSIEEEDLLHLIKICLEHGCTADELDFSHPSSLIRAVQKFPRNVPLVTLLLAHGCNPDASISCVIDPTAGEESIHLLLWALLQQQKVVSSAVIVALLQGGASATRIAPLSEAVPIAVAASEGRADVVTSLLVHGADASIRDKSDRSALFYASSSSVTSIVETLAPHSQKNDGSLHEAARMLQIENVSTLIESGHAPCFASRLHGGRDALGEFCLETELSNSIQRSKARRLLRLLLDNGARPNFKARNERSAVILALDNARDPLGVTEVLVETEVWEQLNDDKHMFYDAKKGLWYSPLSYVEHVPSPARAKYKQQLLDLLRDKGCEPRYYSETEHQPSGAVGLPAAVARLADRQREHQLKLKLAKEVSEHARMLEETAHLDLLRRKREQQDAELAAAAASAAHTQSLEQRQHDSAMQRVREAERMKRAEKVAWHTLLTQQEHDSATQRAQIEERKGIAAYVAESRLIEARKGEMEHRAGVEKRALKEKEEHTQKSVRMQMQIQDRVDESARLHAGLSNKKQLEWGTVD